MGRDRIVRIFGGVLLGALVTVVTFWFAWPDSSDDRHEAFFPLIRVMPDQSAAYRAGDSCSFDTDASNQLIVMLPDGELIGWYQPTSGTLARYADEEEGASEVVWVCETVAAMDLPQPPRSVPYYLVQVNRAEPLLERAALHYVLLGTSLPLDAYRWEDAPTYPPQRTPVDEVGS